MTSMSRKMASAVIALGLSLGFVTVTELTVASPAAAESCERGGDYGEFTPDDGQPVVHCNETPAPSPTTSKPSPKPSAHVDPKPTKPTVKTTKVAPKPVTHKPVAQVASKPKTVVKAAPKVVRQNALPPAKITATGVKVCVVKVTVTNSGGSPAKVHVADKVITLPAKSKKVVTVPVRPDGTWSITVTGPSFKKVLRGGCDCAKTAAAQLVRQDAVPSVQYHFPWLVVLLGAAAASGVTAVTMRKRGARQ